MLVHLVRARNAALSARLHRQNVNEGCKKHSRVNPEDDDDADFNDDDEVDDDDATIADQV